MKERILVCPNCKEETRHRVTNRYRCTRDGKLRRKVEHCTKCNIKRLSKK